MVDIKVRKCTDCIYSHTCYLLKVVRENNEIRVTPPYTTRFLAASYDLASICMLYDMRKLREAP